VSELRSAKSAPFPNKRAEQDLWEQPDEDDGTPQVVKGRMLADGLDVEHHATVEFKPEEIIGRTFLTPIDSHGHRKRIQIAEVLEHEQTGSEASKAKTIFRCMTADDNKYYDILSYEQVMDMASSEDNAEENVWRFKSIVGHNGPIPC
jgi:hypothetical protein